MEKVLRGSPPRSSMEEGPGRGMAPKGPLPPALLPHSTQRWGNWSPREEGLTTVCSNTRPAAPQPQ